MEIWGDRAACARFAVLVELAEELRECAVCGRLQNTHDLTGVRLLTLKEAKDERLALLGSRDA